MHTTNSSIGLRTKSHFDILDGMRGIAAIAVVIFHFMEIATPNYNDSFIAHSYLAVDFFFCLSGFVIAYAYDKKMKDMGLLQFLKRRLIRLHPLVIICSLLGLLAFLYDPFSNLHEQFSSWQVFLMFLSSCFLIPYPIVPERYFNLFHLNPPTWSLFWEYIANIFYALILVRLRHRLLWLLTVIAAAMLFITSYQAGFLAIGYGGDNVAGGGFRIFYSFLVGILAYRSNWIIKNNLGFFPLCGMLALVFFIPFSDQLNWIIDPILVIFYFPFLIALGAGAHLSQKQKSTCTFLGDLSYPLYMVHYPFIWIFMSYVEQYRPAMSEMRIIIPIAVLLLIGLAYFTLIALDIPIRQYLTQRMKRRDKRSKVLSALKT